MNRGRRPNRDEGRQTITGSYNTSFSYILAYGFGASNFVNDGTNIQVSRT